MFGRPRWPLRRQTCAINCEEAEAMYGLSVGALDIAISISDDEEIIVHRAQPGFWIGHGALLSDIPHFLSVQAASECELFKVPKAALRKNLSEFPTDWMYFHRSKK